MYTSTLDGDYVRVALDPRGFFLASQIARLGRVLRAPGRSRQTHDVDPLNPVLSLNLRLVVEPGSDPNSVITGTALAREHQIDTVVVDFNMPDLDRNQVTQVLLMKAHPALPVVIGSGCSFARALFHHSGAFDGFGLHLNREVPLAEFGKEYVRMEVLLCSPDTGSQWVAE